MVEPVTRSSVAYPTASKPRQCLVRPRDRGILATAGNVCANTNGPAVTADDRCGSLVLLVNGLGRQAARPVPPA